MKKVLTLVVLTTVLLPEAATAMQTEVDPQAMERKRAAKVAWDERQQKRREREAAEAAAVDVAEPDESVSVPVGTSGVDWFAIAECESGGNWSIDSTYDGGLQFHPDTWLRAGGGRFAPYAYLASPAEQIATAERWVQMTGCVHCSSGWPHCGIYA